MAVIYFTLGMSLRLFYCKKKLLTPLALSTSLSPSTALYQTNHNELFAANDMNKLICNVILAHFNDDLE